MDGINQDFQRYKLRAFTLFLLVSYSVIHIKLTGIYDQAALNQWFDLSVRMPFGQRMMMPLLARGMAYLLPAVRIDFIFFILEFAFVCLLYLALKRLMAYEFPFRQAQLLSWLFILLLPLITVINYRDGEAAFYYPYDTASLSFMAGGIFLCLEKRWAFFIPWLMIATLNRESSILLVVIIPILHYQNLKSVIKPLVIAIVAYWVVRAGVLMCTSDLPGPLMEWYFRRSIYTYFESNWAWLFAEENLFIFLFCFAGIPALWFTFYDYIPLRYRLLRYLAFIYFCGLSLVGNFMEARIFAEIVMIIYLPVCVAIKRWLMQEPPYLSPLSQAYPWVYYINRYAILLFFSVIVLFKETWQALLHAWLSLHH